MLLSALFFSPTEMLLLFVLSGAVVGTFRYAYTDGNARFGEIAAYSGAAGMVVIATVAYGEAAGHALWAIALVGLGLCAGRLVRRLRQSALTVPPEVRGRSTACLSTVLD
ncbi:hypothetical protein ACFV9C_38080 [Kribbella sp. NPDC059898]|uniref:hypothetical protein n=1 Tax=Kribbella sp. NPDC059898 TaxID=3346995 RepID=UPI0036504A7A